MSRTAADAPTESRLRKVQEDALFRAAADQAPQVMWIVNAKGAVTYLNHAWYELVGGTPPKWQGHEWGEVVHPDDLAQMRERWQAACVTGSIFEGTRRVRAQGGQWHTLSYKATPVIDEQGLACWVGMDSDITDLIAAQAALRVANDELEAFSYTVSHDLRTPLVTLQGFSQLLKGQLAGATDRKASHYLDRITTAVDHMSNLVSGLHALSQVARESLDYEVVDLSALALEVIDMHAHLSPGRLVTVAVQPGLVARADKRLMTVLLDNLLGNAWKFTSATPQANISMVLATRSPTESIFCVQDNGAGFEMARAGNLFTPFERLHTAAEFPGTGIGLATVRRVVVRHGGQVWALSEPGKGSRFYFSLPHERAARID